MVEDVFHFENGIAHVCVGYDAIFGRMPNAFLCDVEL